MIKYEVGQRVRCKQRLIEHACGDHPAWLLCEKGDEVIVRSVGGNFHPVYVSHESITDNSFGVQLDEIEPVSE